jgi:hypothetical protein
MSEKQFFEEIDDCILAAYKHVKDTGYKISNYFESTTGDAVGLASEDGYYFMMWMEHHNVSQKRKLARRIRKLNISIVDFINRQLILFL